MKIIDIKYKGEPYQLFVDDEDYEKVIPYKWYLNARNGKPTSVYTKDIKKGVTVYMHRFLLGIEGQEGKGIHTDHIDRNPLNNQKSNLRKCTIAENNFNRLRESNTSQYKGVYKNTMKKYSKPFSVKVQFEGIRLSVAETFASEEEAARVHDKIAKKLHGEFALLNFPE